MVKCMSPSPTPQKGVLTADLVPPPSRQVDGGTSEGTSKYSQVYHDTKVPTHLVGTQLPESNPGHTKLASGPTCSPYAELRCLQRAI